MTERGFDTGYWTDPFVKKLSPYGKLLFSYLWTNDHCNQAGIYELDLETIAFETKLPEVELPDLLRSLKPKVEWFPDLEIVWVRNFIARQAKSPKFLIAVANCLKRLNNNGISQEVVAYNLKHHRVSIPYSYTTDIVSIHSTSASISNSKSKSDKGKEVVKGKGEVKAKEPIPTSESEIEESLSLGDRGVISTWRSVRGFRMSPSDASELVARLRTEFPDLDILGESKKWAARKLSEPLTKKARPSAQIWNWMCKGREFKQERGKVGQQFPQRRGYPEGPGHETKYEWEETPNEPNDSC